MLSWGIDHLEIGFFLLLLLAVMVLLLALVYRSTYQHTLSQVAGQLNFAHAVLSNELQSHRRAQSAMADLIPKDFTLLGEIDDLIASPQQEAQSLSAALESFASRSRASFALVSAPEGLILAGTSGELLPGAALPRAELADYQPLQWQLASIFTIALLLAGLGALLIATACCAWP